MGCCGGGCAFGHQHPEVSTAGHQGSLTINDLERNIKNKVTDCLIPGAPF